MHREPTREQAQYQKHRDALAACAKRQQAPGLSPGQRRAIEAEGKKHLVACEQHRASLNALDPEARKVLLRDNLLPGEVTTARAELPAAWWSSVVAGEIRGRKVTALSALSALLAAKSAPTAAQREQAKLEQLVLAEAAAAARWRDMAAERGLPTKERSLYLSARAAKERAFCRARAELRAVAPGHRLAFATLADIAPAAPAFGPPPDVRAQLAPGQALGDALTEAAAALTAGEMTAAIARNVRKAADAYAEAAGKAVGPDASQAAAVVALVQTATITVPVPSTPTTAIGTLT